MLRCEGDERLEGPFKDARRGRASQKVLAAAANMWLGVSQAGYSFREELPIFLLIFLLPSAVAMFVKWKFL
jgi:hypothetical protein